MYQGKFEDLTDGLSSLKSLETIQLTVDVIMSSKEQSHALLSSLSTLSNLAVISLRLFTLEVDITDLLAIQNLMLRLVRNFSLKLRFDRESTLDKECEELLAQLSSINQRKGFLDLEIGDKRLYIY